MHDVAFNTVLWNSNCLYYVQRPCEASETLCILNRHLFFFFARGWSTTLRRNKIMQHNAAHKCAQHRIKYQAKSDEWYEQNEWNAPIHSTNIFTHVYHCTRNQLNNITINECPCVAFCFSTQPILVSLNDVHGESSQKHRSWTRIRGRQKHRKRHT